MGRARQGNDIMKYYTAIAWRGGVLRKMQVIEDRSLAGLIHTIKTDNWDFAVLLDDDGQTPRALIGPDGSAWARWSEVRFSDMMVTADPIIRKGKRNEELL